MRISKFTVLLSTLLLASVFGLASLPAHAATPEDDGTFNIVTSPLPINLKVTPGSSVTTDIRVMNGGTSPEKLKVSLMKFSAYGEEGKPSIQDRESGDDYFDWVSFAPASFDAAPNKWVTVKMTIKLPKTAAFGYYYAAVFSRANSPQPTNAKQNVLVGSAAVLVLVDVDVPGAKRTAKITSFKADKRFYEFLPAKFTVKIRNEGNIHLVPTGNIFLTRGGKPVATLHVNAAAGNVLPKSNRIFTADWKDGFPVYTEKEAGGEVVLDEHDKPVSSLKWDFGKASKLRFGHYTAHMLLAYDDGKSDVPMEATVSFWVVPWRVVGLGIAIPVVPSVLVYILMRRRFNRRLKKEMAKKNVEKTTS